ncbi:keratin-associated protein 19-2-like [Macrobrachium nipponense]|uniref:keratin-associated protein 19-2-like n=1 Tax=Macrobrachium nipponense TaxID=159736 RepID=UPI0030C8851A
MQVVVAILMALVYSTSAFPEPGGIGYELGGGFVGIGHGLGGGFGHGLGGGFGGVSIVRPVVKKVVTVDKGFGGIGGFGGLGGFGGGYGGYGCSFESSVSDSFAVRCGRLSMALVYSTSAFPEPGGIGNRLGGGFGGIDHGLGGGFGHGLGGGFGSVSIVQ